MTNEYQGSVQDFPVYLLENHEAVLYGTVKRFTGKYCSCTEYDFLFDFFEKKFYTGNDEKGSNLIREYNSVKGIRSIQKALKNHCIDHERTEKKRYEKRSVMQKRMKESGIQSADANDETGLAALVEEVAEMMSPDLFRAFRLYAQGSKLKDIAFNRGINYSTLNGQILRVRKKLRDYFRDNPNYDLNDFDLK